MADFKGVEGNAHRIILIEKQREKERKQFEEHLKKIKEDAEKGVVSMESKFAVLTDSMEENLKASTVGLVTLEDFRKKRITLELEEANSVSRKQDTSDPTKKRKSQVIKSKLSFGDEEHDQEEEQFQKKQKSKKNPFVETSFLPDREREQREKVAREQLAVEWFKKQQALKSEPLAVTYSFCDGSGQRRTTKVTKGASLGRFLEAVRQDCKEFRGVSADSMMFVKDDIIIPHHITFYDLSLAKARGKSGDLLFNFGEEPPEKSNEPFKDEPRHTKVVERRWYDMNKHIFPACKWELYDPTKTEIKKQ